MKLKRCIAFIIGVVLVVFCVTLYCSFQGNPISHMIVNHNSKNYIKEKYPKHNFSVESSSYNFKDNHYVINIKDPKSIDTHFTIEYDLKGNLIIDNYKDVTSGLNTFYRLEEEYRSFVEKVMLSSSFPLPKSEIQFATIQNIEDTSEFSLCGQFGIDMTKLELDKEFDLKEVGKKAGVIICYVEDENVSIENASQMILKLKEYLNKNNVYFYAVDFHLSQPNDNEVSIDLIKFLSSDIYSSNLKERVENGIKKTKEYYKILDEIKKDDTNIK